MKELIQVTALKVPSQDQLDQDTTVETAPAYFVSSSVDPSTGQSLFQRQARRILTDVTVLSASLVKARAQAKKAGRLNNIGKGHDFEWGTATANRKTV